MKSVTKAIAASFMAVCMATGAASAQQPQNQPSATTPQMQDDRELIQLNPQIRAGFLAMMRGFVESLDDLMTALGEKDFAEVARIANDDLGPAHELMIRLKNANVPPEKIAEIRKLARERMAKALDEGQLDGPMGMGWIAMKVLGGPIPGMQPGMGGMGGMGGTRGGFGPFLPSEVRAMGIQMHLEAAKVAEIAEQVATAGKPSAEDYRKVIQAISGMTTQCRACHAAWRVW